VQRVAVSSTCWSHPSGPEPRPRSRGTTRPGTKDESTTKGALTSAQRCLQRVDLSSTGKSLPSTSTPLATDQCNRRAADNRRVAAFGQKPSLNHPVGLRSNQFWNHDAKLLGGLLVDHQLKPVWHLDR